MQTIGSQRTTPTIHRSSPLSCGEKKMNAIKAQSTSPAKTRRRYYNSSSSQQTPSLLSHRSEKNPKRSPIPKNTSALLIDLTQSDHGDSDQGEWEEIPPSVYQEMAIELEKHKLQTLSETSNFSSCCSPSTCQRDTHTAYSAIPVKVKGEQVTPTKAPPHKRKSAPARMAKTDDRVSTAQTAEVSMEDRVDQIEKHPMVSNTEATPTLTDAPQLETSPATHLGAQIGSDTPPQATAAVVATKTNTDTAPFTFLPQRGCLCRVYSKVTCFFSNRRQVKEDNVEPMIRLDWLPAQVEKVSWDRCRKTAKVQVRFFDETILTVDYQQSLSNVPPERPRDNDFEMLVPVPGSSTAFSTIWSKDTYFDRDHSRVQTGDKVRALSSHGGQENSCTATATWCAGRVVRVRRGTTSGTVCDILFDDGHYETSIPLSSEYVCILQKGWQNPEWLLGLSVVSKKKAGRKKGVGVVQTVAARGAVQIAFPNPKSNRTRMDTMAYMTVVPQLMQTAIQSIPRGNKHRWSRNQEDCGKSQSSSSQSTCTSLEAETLSRKTSDFSASSSNDEKMPGKDEIRTNKGGGEESSLEPTHNLFQQTHPERDKPHGLRPHDCPTTSTSDSMRPTNPQANRRQESKRSQCTSSKPIQQAAACVSKTSPTSSIPPLTGKPQTKEEMDPAQEGVILPPKTTFAQVAGSKKENSTGAKGTTRLSSIVGQNDDSKGCPCSTKKTQQCSKVERSVDAAVKRGIYSSVVDSSERRYNQDVLNIIPPRPERGSLCRIFCKTSNFLSTKRQSKASKQEAEWFPAKVEKITWNKAKDKAKILARFFDQSFTTVDYQHAQSPPSPKAAKNEDFEMLVPNEGSSSAFRTIWSSEMFYQRDPTKLEVGDRVQALFQNGQGGTSEAWYTGRVVHVRTDSSGGPVCDILYDDGEYETGVPISSKFVHILEEGWQCPNWLLELPFERKPGRTRRRETGWINTVAPKGPVKVAFTNPDTKQTCLESKAYSTVVHALLESAVHDVPAEKRHTWFVRQHSSDVLVTETEEANDHAKKTHRSKLSDKDVGGRGSIHESHTSTRTQTNRVNLAEAHKLRDEVDDGTEQATRSEQHEPRRPKIDAAQIDEYISKVFFRYRAGGNGEKCLKALKAYIGNAVDHPEEQKFKTINTDNKAFKDKIKPCVGAEQLLMAVGFQRSEGSRGKLVLSDDANYELLSSAKTKLDTVQLAKPLGTLGEIVAVKRGRRGRGAVLGESNGKENGTVAASAKQAVVSLKEDVSGFVQHVPGVDSVTCHDSRKATNPSMRRPPKCSSNKPEPRNATATKTGDVTTTTKTRGKMKTKVAEHVYETVTEEARENSSAVYAKELIVPRRHQVSESTTEMKELAPALSKAIEKCLHSCDTHLGGELLSFMAIQHNRDPSWEICQSLVKLLLRGPLSGNTAFPDCQRMERAEECIRLCLARNAKLHERFLDVAGPSFWSDCIESIVAKHYVVEGDEDRMTTYAIDRVAQSVHVKACCAGFFLRMLEYQLGDFVCGGGDMNVDHEMLMQRSLVKDIVGHRRGPKEALERCVKALASQWVLLGHFVNGEPDGLIRSGSEVSDDSLHFLQEQISRLLKLLGKITSYIAWLYNIVEKESPTTLAHLFYNMASNLIDGTDFDPSPFLKQNNSKDNHWSGVRLRLILGLDKRIIPEVRPILADLMNVGMAFNIIFAC